MAPDHGQGSHPLSTKQSMPAQQIYSPTQLTGTSGGIQSAQNNKLAASRGKMQQRYSNYLTQQML